jgi:cytochrome-b5 reductase
VIEFIIKAYPEHEGVTKALHSLEPGSPLLISAPFGTIRYQNRGTFIAGGAGITPFIAMLRELASKGGPDGHSLIFVNKTPADIICENELRFSELLFAVARVSAHRSGGKVDRDPRRERA